MASTISSSSSLTPADSVSILSGSAPSSTDVEIKRLDGKTFVRVHLERLKRPRRGWWWNFGAEWEETSSPDAKFHWVCAVCVRWKAFLTTSSQHIQDHLAKIHGVVDPANTIGRAVPILDQVVHQRRELTTTEKDEIRRKRCRKALLEWFAHDRIAFSQVESDHFKAFCASLNEDYVRFIPSSHTSISSWLKAEFALKRADVAQQLVESKSLIHLSFDLWTSPQKTFTVISTVAHFLRPDYTNQSILLSLRKVEGTHSGENQAEHILDTLRTFKVDRLGYFVCDNHGSNDTAIRAVLKEYEIPEQEERRRLRCLGHIINLAAQAFLFGRDAEAFENEDLEDVEVAYRLWQSAGPVG